MNREIAKMKNTYWEKYTEDLEYYIYGTHKTL